MFEKDLKLSLLYDLYGGLLSEKKRQAFESYYSDDLSLAEIAENCGVSRQAVRDLLCRSGEELRATEAELGLMQKREKLRAACDALACDPDPASRAEILQKLRDLI